MSRGQMIVVVVKSLADTVEDVVGPFWYMDTAEKFARLAERKHGKRCDVRRVIERQVWEAGQE